MRLMGNRVLSTEKTIRRQWGKQEKMGEEDMVEGKAINFHNLHPQVQGVSGINSSVSTYNVMVSGVSGGPAWEINMSTLPGQQRRLLTVISASTFLVNYAQDSYPARINIIINQVVGSLDQQGSPSHNVAALAPQGAAIPVVNPGNIIGYNVSYGLLTSLPAIDITGLPSLTFDISADQQTTPVSYPLATPISLVVQVTHVLL